MQFNARNYHVIEMRSDMTPWAKVLRNDILISREIVIPTESKDKALGAVIMENLTLKQHIEQNIW